MLRPGLPSEEVAQRILHLGRVLPPSDLSHLFLCFSCDERVSGKDDEDMDSRICGIFLFCNKGIFKCPYCQFLIAGVEIPMLGVYPGDYGSVIWDPVSVSTVFPKVFCVLKGVFTSPICWRPDQHYGPFSITIFFFLMPRLSLKD